MQGLEINIDPLPLQGEEAKQHRSDVFRIVSDAINTYNDGCIKQGKRVNLRAMIEALIALQLAGIMRAAKCDETTAFNTLLSSVATFHSHNSIRKGGELDETVKP